MKNRAFFLDRDGVINVEADYLHEAEKTELLPGVPEAVAEIHRHGFLAVVVTNQSGVARGMFPESDVHAVHRKLQELIAAANGEKLDAFYMCCHHAGYTGSCNCRKPAPGMLFKAAEDLDIDLSCSYMIGDRMSDLEAGGNAGCRVSCLVKTGYGQAEAGKAAAAGFMVADDLHDAVTRLLEC